MRGGARSVMKLSRPSSRRVVLGLALVLPGFHAFAETPVSGPEALPSAQTATSLRGLERSAPARDAAPRVAAPSRDALSAPPPASPPEVEAPPPPPLPPWGDVKILGTTLSTGTRGSASLTTSASYSGTRIRIPVRMVRGASRGRTLCLTGGIHGDELNGVEIVRRALQRVDPERLHGTVIGLPVVNLHGFRRGERDLPDRRDLNRHFPGRRKGSAASRVAFRVFNFMEAHCDEAIDFHTGSSRRTNFPQVRADVDEPAVLELATRLSPPLIVHSHGNPGMLRRALSDAGIPTVTFEAGEAMRFQLDVIEGVVFMLVRALQDDPMRVTLPPAPDQLPEIFLQSRWIRVDRGGILTNRVDLGEPVEKGQLLGTVQAPFDDKSYDIVASHDGIIIGLAHPQLVLPGFAAFHLGFDPDEEVAPEYTDDPAIEHSESEPLE